MHYSIDSDEKVIYDVEEFLPDEIINRLDDGDYRTALERAKTALFKQDVGEWYESKDVAVALEYCCAIMCIDISLEGINVIDSWTPGDDRYFSDDLHVNSEHEPLVRLYSNEIRKRMNAYKCHNCESEKAFRERMGLV